jgi:hypothetical protein
VVQEVLVVEEQEVVQVELQQYQVQLIPEAVEVEELLVLVADLK